MKKWILPLLVFTMIFGTGCNAAKPAETPTDEQKQGQEEPQAEQKEQEVGGLEQLEMPKKGEEVAVLETDHGIVKMRLFPANAPKAVENFKTLAKEGYYDGLTFHRVINDFMIQTGDPTATGSGGESMWGEDFEIELSPVLHFYRGALAMANTGQPKSNGSQFFIVQQKQIQQEISDEFQKIADSKEPVEVPIGENKVDIRQFITKEVVEEYQKNGGAGSLEWILGTAYTVFGQVFEGIDVVDSIATVEVGKDDKPVKDVIVKGITFENYEG